MDPPTNGAVFVPILTQLVKTYPVSGLRGSAEKYAFLVTSNSIAVGWVGFGDKRRIYKPMGTHVARIRSTNWCPWGYERAIWMLSEPFCVHFGNAFRPVPDALSRAMICKGEICQRQEHSRVVGYAVCLGNVGWVLMFLAVFVLTSRPP